MFRYQQLFCSQNSRICNKIGGMGSALMRRFAYSIEFPKADADVRVNQWRYLVRKAEVETLLPTSFRPNIR